MSYYDFDYFWTHEEIGGKKLDTQQQARKRNFLLQIWQIITNKQDDFLDSQEN
ncbi:MAG: hypothetical protein AAFQ80_22725 [Cyanobacteria bacterium J06621_8]